MKRRLPRPALALIAFGLLSSASCLVKPPSPPPGAIVLGTADPLLVLDIDPRGRWVAACQARRDTSGDGKISVWTGSARSGCPARFHSGVLLPCAL